MATRGSQEAVQADKDGLVAALNACGHRREWQPILDKLDYKKLGDLMSAYEVGILSGAMDEEWRKAVKALAAAIFAEIGTADVPQKLTGIIDPTKSLATITTELSQLLVACRYQLADTQKKMSAAVKSGETDVAGLWEECESQQGYALIPEEHRLCDSLVSGMFRALQRSDRLLPALDYNKIASRRAEVAMEALEDDSKADEAKKKPASRCKIGFEDAVAVLLRGMAAAGGFRPADVADGGPGGREGGRGSFVTGARRDAGGHLSQREMTLAEASRITAELLKVLCVAPDLAWRTAELQRWYRLVSVYVQRNGEPEIGGGSETNLILVTACHEALIIIRREPSPRTTRPAKVGDPRDTKAGKLQGECSQLVREGECKRGGPGVCPYTHPVGRELKRLRKSLGVVIRKPPDQTAKLTAAQAQAARKAAEAEAARLAGLRPTPECIDFKLGRCQRGAACKYTHAGPAPPPGPPPARPPAAAAAAPAGAPPGNP